MTRDEFMYEPTALEKFQADQNRFPVRGVILFVVVIGVVVALAITGVRARNAETEAMESLGYRIPFPFHSHGDRIAMYATEGELGCSICDREAMGYVKN